ncbi:MAG: hypothetical protein M3364_08230 [Actinomycetota bacterium]|nr:hypothetical protein [Actinomycetota bacterium]
MARRHFAAIVLCLAAMIVPASAPAQTNPLRVLWAAPEDKGKIAVERISARSGNVQETWRLNMDVAIKNDGATAKTLTRIEIGYPDSPVTIVESKYVPGFLSIPPGEAKIIQLPENRELPFPVRTPSTTCGR